LAYIADTYLKIQEPILPDFKNAGFTAARITKREARTQFRQVSRILNFPNLLASISSKPDLYFFLFFFNILLGKFSSKNPGN